MKELGERAAKRMLRLSPYVHTLVVVAIFISLGANLFVAFYADAKRPVLVFAAACLMMVSAWLYLPIVAASDRIFREAAGRREQSIDDVVEQLLSLESETGTVGLVARRFVVSSCAFGLAVCFLFSKELSGLPALAVWYAQPVVNGLVAGCMYALVALSFNLIYGACRFFHFAHSAVIACGAYTAYVTVHWGGSNILAWVLAATLSGAVGWAMNKLVYAKLRYRGARSTELLLASLGLMVAAQAAISLIFGDDAKALRAGPARVGRLVFPGARLTDVQLAIGSVSIAVLLLVILLLRWSRAGALIRAVANDPELALAVGMPVETIIGGAFVGGSIIAGMAGVLAAHDANLTPSMGLRALLLGVSASIVGGLGTNMGALFGGLLIGLTQNVVAVWMPTQWQDTSIFLVLILFLLLRPQGFAGRPAVRALD
jgi:branched-subunit amino acid ABC-type transport system permease component